MSGIVGAQEHIATHGKNKRSSPLSCIEIRGQSNRVQQILLANLSRAYRATRMLGLLKLSPEQHFWFLPKSKVFVASHF